MTELALLSLVRRYPHRATLARRRGERVFPALQRLEASGLVLRKRESYRLTARGKRELDLHRALTRVVGQALRANTSAAQPSSAAVVACIQPGCPGRSPSR
jgi:hypothetical protein